MDGVDSLIATTNEIERKWTGKIRIIVGTHVEYGPIIEFGSDPHTIKGNPLAFKVNGNQVFATKVEHPGTRPYPFMRPAAESAERNAKAIAKKSDSLEDFATRMAAHIERVAKETITANGNVDTGNLRGSIRWVRVE